MLDLKTLRRLAKEARESMCMDSDGEEIKNRSSRIFFLLLFYLLPIVIAGVTYYNSIRISEIDGYVGTVISIFTGLFFSLLLGISDKIRGEQLNSDVDNGNFQRYKQNMKQIASIILYIILLGVEIFILLFLNSIFGHYVNGCIEIVITVLISYILTRFVVSLLFVTQRFYYTTRDEIRNIL